MLETQTRKTHMGKNMTEEDLKGTLDMRARNREAREKAGERQAMP